ncbi:hypothetical protein HOLleu_02274 [Holothuria leucospilota]|uniref:Uncharacterized protein n=1 Tax=Holothuria leucospilota TaxID=206669 RepID=A0A9Q1CPE9_HOLLE|nr:hypothetical protein HOLleu_02274 [Holothuria leucospilota]
MAFALFNFFSRNEIEVGRVSWITSEFDQEKMTNDRWDMAQVLQVGWPKNGALIQLSPGSARYPAKIISISDDKEELLSLRNEMEKGLESLPKPQEMGRGHRVKRKSKGLNYSSDETVETEPAKPKKKKKKQHAARSKESSHFQRLMTEVLQNEIKKKQQPLLQDHAEAIQELRDEISQLKTEKKQLEMENRNLRKTIQLMKGKFCQTYCFSYLKLRLSMLPPQTNAYCQTKNPLYVS